jgi:hypothetical protein
MLHMTFIRSYFRRELPLLWTTVQEFGDLMTTKHLIMFKTGQCDISWELINLSPLIYFMEIWAGLCQDIEDGFQ